MAEKIWKLLVLFALLLLGASSVGLYHGRLKLERRVEALEKQQLKEKNLLSVTRYAVMRLVEGDPDDCSVGQKPVCVDRE